MMPRLSGREKAESGVFLTVPRAVAMKTKWSSEKTFTGNTIVIFSFSSSGQTLTSGLPREVREPCGTSQTLSQ